ncbi:MAG TPA: hypothetical protein VHZ24_16690 [Pirellulales bacterium]|jgi:hypothetical protein|nr:hypothetical protein [Pirellulales bacterium]
MNKAFVKEPDTTVTAQCPRCGSLGVAVGEATLDAHLPGPTRQMLGDAAFFCPYPTCEVAYFDAFERTVPVEALAEPVYPKDPAAPICPCFGFTCAVVDQDIAEGSVQRTRALIEKARSPEARCATRAADGRSCVAEVQRYYMHHRPQA